MQLERLVYSRGQTFYINPCSTCTNDCLFCVRQFADGVYGFPLILERNPSVEEMRKAIQEKWHDRYNDVAVVGFGEPLLNLDAVLAAARQIEVMSDLPVRINTNGHAELIFPDRDVAAELAASGIHHIQISLNAQDAETYQKLCRPVFGSKTFDAVLSFAQDCSKHMELQISVLELPGVDIQACQNIASELNADFHVRTYHGPDEVLGLITQELGIFNSSSS